MSLKRQNNVTTSFWRHNDSIAIFHSSHVFKLKSSNLQSDHLCLTNKTNQRDLIAATGLVILFKLDWNLPFLGLCDLEIWWITSKTTGHLFYTNYCIKLFASFHIHWWIQTGVTVSENVKFVSKWTIFVPCDLDIWWMTLKNNKAPSPDLFHVLYIISYPLVNSNRSYCPETPNVGPNRRFLSYVTLKFDRWQWKTIVHLFYATSICVHHFVAICEIKLELWSRKSQNWDKICLDLCDLHLWPLTLTFCMDITFVNGNNSWKYHGDTVTGTLWKRRHRRTDRRAVLTDTRTEVFSEPVNFIHRRPIFKQLAPTWQHNTVPRLWPQQHPSDNMSHYSTGSCITNVKIFSKKAAMPLAEILAACRKNVSNTGPRVTMCDHKRV